MLGLQYAHAHFKYSNGYEAVPPPGIMYLEAENRKQSVVPSTLPSPNAGCSLHNGIVDHYAGATVVPFQRASRGCLRGNGDLGFATGDGGTVPALKYRLHCGRRGACVVRYDKEQGKGYHRHYGGA